MANKRSRAHHKKNLTTPPENWQEAMDRGVFLLNEHNRGFVEYISPEVHLPAMSPLLIVMQSLLFAGLALFGIGLLYSFNYDNTRGRYGKLFDPPPAPGMDTFPVWWFLLASALVIVAAVAYSIFRVRNDLQRKRALVLEGRVIFVSIHSCTVMSKFMWDSKIYLNYDFDSPATSQQLHGRFVGNAIGTLGCPAKGMVAAVLFKSDKEYQAL
jgi:hypothetical protein